MYFQEDTRALLNVLKLEQAGLIGQFNEIKHLSNLNTASCSFVELLKECTVLLAIIKCICSSPEPWPEEDF